jgi:hypothetical protein
MLSTFDETATVFTIVTLIVCFLLVRKSIRTLFFSFDGILALLGLIIGVFMTIMNNFYTSNALFLLSPTIAISCSVYIHYKQKLVQLTPIYTLNSNNTSHFSRYLDIFFWGSFAFLLILLHIAEPYTRLLIFFIVISLSVAALGLDIILCLKIDWMKRSYLIIKIFLLSLLIRASAYFISRYPVGSDPWVHSKYIFYFTESGRLTVPDGFPSDYINYPIAHILSTISGIFANLEIKESLFVVSIVLVIGAIFVYLIVRLITGNEQIALLSFLLVSFFDSSIQWSIQVIAMSFGIVLYSFMLYLFFKLFYSKNDRRIIYSLILFPLLFLIVWTHTISSFIMLITIISLFISIYIYNTIYGNKYQRLSSFLITAGIFSCLLLMVKWFNPQYSFTEMILRGLFNSLAEEASFLVNESFSNISGNWLQLYDMFGFVIYTFFGIIGVLHCISKKKVTWPVFALLFVASVLFFIRYAFPILGMRNVIPDRWPAFAIVSFILFVSIGILLFLSNAKLRIRLPVVIVLLLMFTSFFMITNGSTNMDSPLFVSATTQRLIWSDSQMTLFGDLVSKYDGTIITDGQTARRPFKVYFDTKNVEEFKLTSSGDFDEEYLNNKLIVWREESLTLPVSIKDEHYFTPLLLGPAFYESLNNFHNCIMNSGGSRVYL